MDGSIMSSLATEQELREDLAAAFRIAARYGWHESVANHFSAAVSADGKQFLLNPRWQHFSTVKASDLLLLDADDPDVMSRARCPRPQCVVYSRRHSPQPAPWSSAVTPAPYLCNGPDGFEGSNAEAHRPMHRTLL